MICPYFKSPLFWHYFWNFGLPRFVLSSFIFAKWFGTEFREIAFYFGSTERNSKLCSLPWNGLERNSENLHLVWFHGTEFRVVFSSAEGFDGSLLLFLFHGTEFWVVFSYAEGFGTEFRDFLFRGTTGTPSEITICSVYSVFCGIIFLSEISNPNSNTYVGGGGGFNRPKTKKRPQKRV
jgi:hypothetical protein